MQSDKYFVKVALSDLKPFEEHLRINGVLGAVHMSSDMTPSGGHAMFSIIMNTQQALSLKLSFPLLGCMNVKRVLDKQLNQSHVVET
jgi:hypothetical protein